MTIELRSLNGINNAIQAINAGDYAAASHLSLRLHHPYFDRVWADAYKQQMETMAQAAGKLSGLVSLDIRPVLTSVSRCLDCTLHVAAVAAAVEKATSLESLTIYMVRLTGTDEEFIKLATSLQRHAKLKTFTMSCKLHFLDGDSTSNDTSLNRVMTSLGSVPSLESVRLVGGYVIGDMSLLTLTSLCQSKFLRELSIVTSGLSDEGLAVLAAGLGNGDGALESLDTLSLWCTPLGMKGCNELVKLLANPRCKLQDFQLSARELEKGIDAKKLFQKLADALGNSTCKTIRIGTPRSSNKLVLESIKTMLRRNYQIRSMRVDIVWTEVKDHEIDFLVKANKLGRGSLFQHDNQVATSCSWMSLFESTENELDNIYYLVRSHPNEFADMGLRDCAQKMPPTKGEIDAMLRRNKGDIRRSLKHALASIREEAITRNNGLGAEFSAHSEYMGDNFEEHKEELEVLYSKSEERIVAKVGDAFQKQKEEMEKVQSESEQRVKTDVGGVLEEQKRMTAEVGNVFEEHKKEIQMLLLKSEELMDANLEKVHAKSEGHYSKSCGRAMIISLMALLFLIFTGKADKVATVSQDLIAYTFGLYNYSNLSIMANVLQTIGIVWLLFLIYANKTEGMRSALQTFWGSILLSASSFFGSTVFGSTILSKTEERIEVKLVDDGIVLEEECTEASVEKAQAHIEKPEVNVAKDDLEKDSKATTITTNNNPEASWSKSKKKRMRQRAKQQKQAEMLYDQNMACSVGDMTKPEARHA